MRGYVKGQITVFLSLLFTIIVSLLLTVIEGARVKAIRFQTECVADMAINSALAEYNRELFSQYDLLFIDTSYGMAQGRIQNTEAHIRTYMDANFNPQEDVIVYAARDWLKLQTQEVNILRAALASDNVGDCMMAQILTYMEGKVGVDVLKHYTADWAKLEEKKLLQSNVTSERNAVESQIDSIGLPQKQIGDEVWEEVPLDNPADAVNATRGGILSLVTERGTLSSESVSLDNYASHRKLNKGTGLSEVNAPDNDMTHELILGEYLLEKCGRYGAALDKGKLQYQIEYILAGKSNDIDNLQTVVKKLLLIREASNMMYLLSDSVKMAEAEALALSLTAVMMLPELAEPVKYSIVFAWAYAESVNDVKILLDGGRVPIVKNSGCWHTALSNLTTYQLHLKSGESSQNGLSYQDYIRLMLLTINHNTKMLRFMDIVEMDIRQTRGNTQFRIDCCMDDLEIKAVVVSAYGYQCDITRRYGYYQ
ncbi:MAG: hypothetical protein IJ485_02225 [Lachnospiraceae bacterium]|nr:hypothetical protein [Lachnospiraceae bacterium]